MSGSQYPLDGYVVVDLSSGIPGGYCTKVLADGGADVIKVEDPAGDSLRRWSASGASIASGDDGALFQYLAGSKRSVVADPRSAADVASVRDLIRSADAVVWSRGSALAELDAFDPHVLRRVAPGATVAALSPFGLDGPWADRAVTEFTLQALCGGVGQRGSIDRPPVQFGGRNGDWMAGMVAAVGVLAARWRNLSTGVGELLDVSELEALVLTHTMYQLTFVDIHGKPMKPVRSLNFPGIERTKDGWVGFMVVTGQQWLDFCVMCGRTDWMDDPELLYFEKRFLRHSELAPEIARWMLDHTTDEIIELGTLLRVPVAPVGAGDTVTNFDHFVEGGYFEDNPRGGFLQPAVPYRLHHSSAAARPLSSAPRLGEHTSAVLGSSRVAKSATPTEIDPTSLPFAGLRIADFTQFWAGPILGHVFGMFGAEVIHIESGKKPDGMRFQSAKTFDQDQWWEWAGLYQGGNTNKSDLTLDMQTDRGRALARQLLAHCDVMVENYSPRVMENWGLSYDEVRAVRPDIIMVRMPAFGLGGPWRDRTGYAQTMEQVSGMAWMTGYVDQEPQVPNGPCDPIAGSHATLGLMMALEHRRRTGEGMLVEVPMVSGALSVAAEVAIEWSAYGAVLQRDGNRGPTAAPQNLYRTADLLADGRQDRWVAIAVETDDQWVALRGALGEPAWATEPSLDTMAGRRHRHDDIDAHLAQWCAERSSDDIVHRLWSVGVPVAKVLMPQEGDQIAQHAARGFYQVVPHPVTGLNRHGGYPVRFEHGPRLWHRRHAPTLGQDNHAILGGLLGLTQTEITQLEADHVIGGAPGR